MVRERPFTGRRLFRLGLPVTILILIAAHSPSVAQRVPRLTFPVVAAGGAALIVFLFGRSLTRLVAAPAADRRRGLLALAFNGAALVFLVLFPALHVVRAISPAGGRAPRIHTGFGNWLSSEGYPRLSPHGGIDVAGTMGADVLAAADGRVSVARDNQDLCGLIVVIDHAHEGLRTVYCHFSDIAVRVGDSVKRGQRIGALGTSGQRAWPGFQHVHLELQRGRDVNAIEDPLPRVVGCFDPAREYPADRLVLTYPVRC